MLVSKKILLVFVSFFVSASMLYAQQETTLPYLTWAPQAGYTDLTIKPDQYKTSLALPIIGSFQLYYMNSAFKYNNLVHGNTIEPNDVIPKLKRMNHLYTGGSYDLLSMRFCSGKTFFQVSVRDVWSQRLNYTKDLANLIWNGNASYAGQTIDLNNERISMNYYREIGLAATRDVGERLTVGVRGKVLMGIANVTTEESKNSLYTDPNGLSISGHSDFTMNTSGFANDGHVRARDILGSSNLGLAADFGARYKVSEKLSIACNVNNIGFIHWKSKIKNYKVNGDYTSTGYVMRDSADIVNANWQNVLDTLQAIYKPVQNSKAYSSWLSPLIYLSANYVLRENTSLYSSIAADIYHGFRPTLTVGATQLVGKTVQATVNYSIMPNNYFNFGGGFVVRGGPAQFYLSCDNVPALFDPYSVKYFNARLGINFLFGKPEKS
jgi:hypothetical protein